MCCSSSGETSSVRPNQFCSIIYAVSVANYIPAPSSFSSFLNPSFPGFKLFRPSIKFSIDFIHCSSPMAAPFFSLLPFPSLRCLLPKRQPMTTYESTHNRVPTSSFLLPSPFLLCVRSFVLSNFVLNRVPAYILSSLRPPRGENCTFRTGVLAFHLARLPSNNCFRAALYLNIFTTFRVCYINTRTFSALHFSWNKNFIYHFHTS